jgi:phage FluMu gp28-like protein
MSVPAVLPATTHNTDTPVLLPYQAAWIADKSPLKVAEKSRRTGFTWGEAADNALTAAAEKSAGGMNVYYIGYNQDMAIEFIEACAMWSRAFNYVAGEIEEGLWDEADDDKHIKTYTIRFPNSGHRIVALSSRPANLRGKQGVVVIDEAAFHDQLDELLKAAIALLIWGGKVRIISTHNGEANPFNDLVQEIRAGKRSGSVHRVEFRQAVQQGLYRRVCLRLGLDWTAEGEAAWMNDVYKFYGDAAAEELDVVPSSGSGVYLTRALIEGVMKPEIPVVRLTMPPEFSEQPKHIREAEIFDWCERELKPLLASRSVPFYRSFLGEDFARTGDLTALWPVQEQPSLSLATLFVVELRGVPFEQQKQIVFYLIDRLPRFSGGAFDARGNGQYLAEVAMQRYGSTRIHQVMLSVEWYRENMPRFKAAFEEKTIDAPKDADILGDLRAVKMDKGIAKVPDSASNKGLDGRDRHGDTAVACALVIYAAHEIAGGAIEFTPAPSRATRWDGKAEDDDTDVRASSGGAW